MTMIPVRYEIGWVDTTRDDPLAARKVELAKKVGLVLAELYPHHPWRLAQLNRSVESRDDKRPMLSDLRESGSIEQDADVVLFLYRQDYYLERAEPQKTDKMTPDQHSKRLLEWREHLESVRGEADVIIAKNRHGRIGTVKLAFQGEFSRFRDLQDADVAAERVARFEGI